MSVVSIGVAVAAPMITSMFTGDAAGDAADAQIAASERASATQEKARVQQRQDLTPWMQGGQSANNALLYRLGLGGSASGGSGPTSMTAEQFRSQLLPQFTRQSTTPGKEVAYHTADDSGQYTVHTDGTKVSRWLAPESETQSTVDEAGLNAAIQEAMTKQQAQQAQYQAQAGSDPQYGSLLRKFDQNDLNSDLVFQNTYKTALDTGLNALNSRAANSGNWGSGAALKALTRFGADTANTYTGGAYNRNMQEKGQTYNFLSGASQQGQNAAAGVGAAGISTANNIAQNQLAAGNAQSAGIVGGANALSGGIADATNAYQWNQLMSKPKTRTDYGAGINSYLYSNAGSGG